MKKLWFVVLGSAFLMGIAGCQGGPNRKVFGLAAPSILRSGSAPQQQRRAQEYDPYPEDDVAPAVVGSRPLGYERARSEVDQAQYDLRWW